MGNIASIHIEPSKENNTVHNDRTIAPDYLLKHKSLGVEVDNNSDAADAIYIAKLNSATEAYTNRVGQKIQAKNIKWSAVVNINKNTTMKDLKKLTSFLEEKYGWQCYQIAIHRDEGHIDKESGETIYNLHAHLELLMLNKDGIYCFKKRDFGKKKMAALQTEIADILGLERGTSREERLEMVAEKLGVNVADIKQRKNEKHDAYVNRIKAFAKTKGFEDFNIFKEIRGSVRQTHQQYKQQKRSEDIIRTELKQQVLTLTEQKKQIEAERKRYKEEREHIVSDYRALQNLNKTLHTQEELNIKIAELRTQYEKRLDEKSSEIAELKIQIQQNQYAYQKEIEKKISVSPKETIVEVRRPLTDDEINADPIIKKIIDKEAKSMFDKFSSDYMNKLKTENTNWALMNLDDLKVVYPKKEIFENAEHYAHRCVRTAINDYANPNYKQVQAKANLRQEKINELKQIIKTKDQELDFKQKELNQTTTELQWYKGFFGIIREKFKKLGNTVGKMLIEDLLSKVTNDLIPFYEKIKNDLDSINQINPRESVLTSSNTLSTINKR